MEIRPPLVIPIPPPFHFRGLSLTLVIYMEKDKKTNDLVVRGDILMPDLPLDRAFETEFIVKMKKLNKRPLLGYIHINLNSTKRPNLVYLQGFFIFSNQYDYKALPEEKTVGLGKWVLCQTMHYLCEINFVKPSDGIFLIAAGGQCGEDHKTRLDTFSWEECIDFLREYPISIVSYNHKWSAHKEVEKIIESLLRKDPTERLKLLPILRNLVCEIQDNLKLTEYYARYGFKVTENGDGTEIRMDATVDQILEYCFPKSKAGKKSKRRRKSKRTL